MTRNTILKSTVRSLGESLVTVGCRVGVCSLVAALLVASCDSTEPRRAVGLAIATQPPADAQIGVALIPPAVVEIRDQKGARLAQPDVSVTVSIASGDGTLTGTTTRTTDADGRATFADLVISGAVGPRTLRFSSNGLTDATSTTITLRAGPAATIEPASPATIRGRVGTPVMSPPAVLLKDASANPVPGAPVTFTVANAGGVVSTTTQTTNASGVAEFTGWTLPTAAGRYTVTATTPSVAGSGVVFTATALTHPAGALASRVQGFTGRPFAVRVSPTSDVVLVTQQDANSVARLRLGSSGPELAVSVGLDPGDVVFNQDGTRAFVSAFISGGLHILDVARGEQVAAIPISTNAYRLALTADDARLFVSSTHGTLYVVDPVGRRVITSVPLQGSLQGLALSSSGRTLVVSSTAGIVWKLDAASLEIRATRAIAGTLQDVAITTDEREIYVASEDGWVDVLDGETLQPKQRITLSGLGPFGLALTPDDAELYVTSPLSGKVAIVDRETRALIRTITVSGTPRRVAFDATGATAVIANEGNWVDIVK